MKKTIILIVFCMLSACSITKSDQSLNQEKEISLSILDSIVLEFAEVDSTNFIYNEPEKLLNEVNSKLDDNKLSPEDEQALLVFKALLLSQIGGISDAFEVMTKALQINDQAEIYALRGFILWREGKLRGAMLDADYANFKQNDLHLATMVQGLVFFSEQKIEKSCEKLNLACSNGQCFGLEFVKSNNQCM